MATPMHQPTVMVTYWAIAPTATSSRIQSDTVLVITIASRSLDLCSDQEAGGNAME